MLKSTRLANIPATTKRVAKAAFPKGSTIMALRDTFGTLYENEDFASLFPNTGQPAYEPWRLALVTVFQYLENLTDRQAADAVRGRLDWKYALSLKLEDPGFDRSVLSEFRARLIQGNMEQVLLDKMLGCFQEKGLLKSAKQRTDSTQVIAAVRQLRRLELAGETMRAALNAIAAAEPDWLRSVAKPEWFERYSHRVEEYRFPKGKDARRAYGDSVAQDGLELLTFLEQPDTPRHLNTLGMVNVLKAVWQQNFEIENGTIRWLTPAELKPSGERFNSPYDTEAFYSTRRETEWIGYKVHVSETCEDDALRVITHVQTTASVTQDVSVTADIHQALADKALLPGTHIVDAGYTDAELLATSQAEHRVRLIGPVRENLSWQAKAAQGFSQDDFVIDWDKEQARCPQGKLSYRWEQKTNKGFDNYWNRNWT